jgi:hypothetical protein
LSDIPEFLFGYKDLRGGRAVMDVRGIDILINKIHSVTIYMKNSEYRMLETNFLQRKSI